MTIGEKILTLRRGRNLSQEKLAERLAVSRQAVSKWELGETTPDTDKIIQLSRVFEVSTDYLLLDDVVINGDVTDTGNHKITNVRFNTRIPFIAATGVSLIGLLVSIVAQLTWQTVLSVSVGFIIQIAAMIFFEVKYAKDRGANNKARRNFYSLNLWLLLPYPVFYLFETVFKFYPYPRFVWVDLLCTLIGYLLLCGIMTLILRKVRV